MRLDASDENVLSFTTPNISIHIASLNTPSINVKPDAKRRIIGR
jgi:hypothetical protein